MERFFHWAELYHATPIPNPAPYCKAQSGRESSLSLPTELAYRGDKFGWLVALGHMPGVGDNLKNCAGDGGGQATRLSQRRKTVSLAPKDEGRAEGSLVDGRIREGRLAHRPGKVSRGLLGARQEVRRQLVFVGEGWSQPGAGKSPAAHYLDSPTAEAGQAHKRFGKAGDAGQRPAIHQHQPGDAQRVAGCV